MFGLSLTELIFTAVLIVVVWRAFKYYEKIKDGASARRKVRAGRGKAAGGAPTTVELAPCPRCGTYRPKGEPCDCAGG